MSLLSARIYLLFNSSILWQTSSPWKVTQAFRVFSSLTVTSRQTGQSENVQYPRQLNKGPFLLDILFFTVCLLKAMLQYGCTDCIPFEIIFVQCSSLNWCPTCRFLRSLHSLVSIKKKKHGPVGRLSRQKRLSGPLFSEDVSDAWVESYLSELNERKKLLNILNVVQCKYWFPASPTIEGISYWCRTWLKL